MGFQRHKHNNMIISQSLQIAVHRFLYFIPDAQDFPFFFFFFLVLFSCLSAGEEISHTHKIKQISFPLLSCLVTVPSFGSFRFYCALRFPLFCPQIYGAGPCLCALVLAAPSARIDFLFITLGLTPPYYLNAFRAVVLLAALSQIHILPHPYLLLFSLFYFMCIT